MTNTNFLVFFFFLFFSLFFFLFIHFYNFIFLGGKWKPAATGKIKSPTGGLQVFWTDGTSDSVVGYNTPKDRWFHYSATYDGVGLIVFINGKQVAYTEVGQKIMGPATAGGDDWLANAKTSSFESDLAYLTPVETDDKEGADQITIGAEKQKAKYVQYLLAEYWEISNLRRLPKLFGGVGEKWNTMIPTPSGESRALHVGDMGSSMGSGLEAAERRATGAGHAARWEGYISVDKDTRLDQLIAKTWKDGGAQIKITINSKIATGSLNLATKTKPAKFRLLDGDDGNMGRLEVNNGGWGTICEEPQGEGKITKSQITNMLNIDFGHFKNCKLIEREQRSSYMGLETTKILRVTNADVANKHILQDKTEWKLADNCDDPQQDKKNCICDHTEDLVVDCESKYRTFENNVKVFPQSTELKAGQKYKITAVAFATMAPKYTSSNNKLLELDTNNGAKLLFWSEAGDFTHIMDGEVDDFKLFREGMTAQQILLEMNDIKSTEELEAEKKDDERTGEITTSTTAAPSKADATEDQEAVAAKKMKEEEETVTTLLMAYSFEDATKTDVPDESENDLNGKTEGQSSLERVVHPFASHIWKSCHGAGGAGEQSNICGGFDDVSNRVRGYCDLSENPPKCHCSKHYRGPGCTKTCPTDPTMGICSGRGKCHWVQAVDEKKGASALAGEYPKPGQSSWCACGKAKDGGKRFLGMMCEKECPASHEKTCSGHGECVLTSKGAAPCAAEIKEGICVQKHQLKKDSKGNHLHFVDGDGKFVEGKNGIYLPIPMLVQKHASCICQDGWFGSGCEKTCAGALDDPKELPDVKNSLPLLGTCAGHGACSYSDEKDHKKCGDNPHRCGPEMGKKCVCDHHGGWFAYPYAGGTCLESCPGAQPKMNVFQRKDITHPLSTDANGNGIPTHNNICNGAGVSHNNKKHKELEKRTFDAVSGRKERSCFLKDMATPALKKLTEKLNCQNTGGKTKEEFPPGKPATNPETELMDCLNKHSKLHNTISYNGVVIDVKKETSAPLKALRDYMKINHKKPAINVQGGWGGYCKQCDEMQIKAKSWDTTCASQDIRPSNSFFPFDKTCGDGSNTEINIVAKHGANTNSFDTNKKERRCGNRFSAASKCLCPVSNEPLEAPAVKKSGMNIAWNKRNDRNLGMCMKGSGWKSGRTNAIETSNRKTIGTGTGMFTAYAWTKKMIPGAYPITDATQLANYPGLQQCGSVDYLRHYKYRNRKCW